MKVRAYVRVAKNTPSGRTRYRVDASVHPKAEPLTTGSGAYERALHTVHFALDIDLPDNAFNPKDWPVLQVVVGEEQAEPIAIRVADA